MARIDLGGGAYLEPDDRRFGRFHRRIVANRDIVNTRVGHYCDLECGHRVMIFGDLAQLAGMALCAACRDAAEGAGQ